MCKRIAILNALVAYYALLAITRAAREKKINFVMAANHYFNEASAIGAVKWLLEMEKDAMMSVIPRRTDAIWGTLDLAPEEGSVCHAWQGGELLFITSFRNEVPDAPASDIKHIDTRVMLLPLTSSRLILGELLHWKKKEEQDNDASL